MLFGSEEMDGVEHLGEQRVVGKSDIRTFFSFLGVVFIPATLLGLSLYYTLFRWAKIRFHLSALLLFFVAIIVFIVTWLSGCYSGYAMLLDFNNYQTNTPYFITTYLATCSLLGIAFAIVFIGIKAWQLRRSPELTQMKGWAYNFKYKQSPFEKMRVKTLEKELEEGKLFDNDKAPVGVLCEDIASKNSIPTPKELKENSKRSVVYRTYTEANTGTLITGGTGSGKTRTALNLIYNDIVTGKPVCVIDFKKGPDVVYFLSKWAKENNRRFFHFVNGRPGTYRNPFCEEQSTYDPLSAGNSTAKADMMLNMRAWDGASTVYKQRTQDILQSIFYLLEVTPHEKAPDIDWSGGGFAQFVSALDIRNLQAMIELLSEESEKKALSQGDERRYRVLSELYKELSQKGQTPIKSQIDELISMSRTLITSSYGDWLAEGESNSHIDLLDIATADDAPIVLFSFNPQEESDFARLIGSIIMADLSRVSSIKHSQGNTNKFCLYIDEFQTLDPSTVKSMLEKSRAAGFCVTLTLQSLEQIVEASAGDGEATLKAIIETVSNFIFHAGATQESATRMSMILGECERIKYRTNSRIESGVFDFNFFNARNNSSTKELVIEQVVEPNSFQSLSYPIESNGFYATAYVVNKVIDDKRLSRVHDGAIARKTHIVVEKEIAKGAPKSFVHDIFPYTKDEVYEISQERIRHMLIHSPVTQGQPQANPRSTIVNQGLPKVNQGLHGVPMVDEDDDWEIEEVEDFPTVDIQQQKQKVQSTSFSRLRQEQQKQTTKKGEPTLPKLY